LSHNGQQPVFILDVGGEGCHPEAWNVNPSALKTVGKQRGQPIPRHIHGRADAIPFADGSVNGIIVERTPLQLSALQEIARVIASPGIIVLRHVQPPYGDPHMLALQILPGRTSHRVIRLGGQVGQETVFRVSSVPHE
jgi:hypothetical protein